jgi:aspartate racemase
MVLDTMKKIGILGGLSPESTAYYYQYITRKYTGRFGDYSFPDIIIYSVNFQQYINWYRNDKWNVMADDIVSVISTLQSAGADFAVMATNTIHYVYDIVAARSGIPIISLVEVVSSEAQKLGISKIGLLGTKFTMEHDFYSKSLKKLGIETLVPTEDEKQIVDDIIFNELTQGIINEDSKKKYLDVINSLVSRGIDGVILGCTEIPLLINQEDVEIHALDSSKIHAEAAFNYALE